MMKYPQIFLTILLCGCATKYSAILCDMDTKKPLENVTVLDPKSDIIVKTDQKGYFKMKIDKTRNLIISKQGYFTDTIPTISIQSGEFIDKKFDGDTIYLMSHTSEYLK